MTVFNLNVTFLAVRDRLLDALQLTVSGNGASKSTQAGLGSRRVRVDWLAPGDTMKLEIEIPDVLRIEEDFVLVANPDDSIGFSIATPPVHPRLGIQPAFSVRQNGTLGIPLDVRFLEVTRRFQSMFPGELLALPGATTRIFEFMAGSPRTWVAMIPSTFAEGEGAPNSVEYLLFFRPELNKNYTDTDTFLLQKQLDGTNKQVPLAYGAFARYAHSPTAPHTYADRFGNFSRYPECGFADQVLSSVRNIVVLFPIPHNASYGLLEAGDISHVILDLTRALQYEGVLSDDPDLLAPFVHRFGVAGFSSGGDTAVTVWSNNKQFIDELYLFDPGHGLPSAVELRDWLKRPDRRLQLICPAHSAEAAQRLGPQIPAGQGTVRASTPSHFFFDPAYVQAHGGADFMTAPNSAPVTQASRVSNIFLVAERLPPDPNPGITLRGIAGAGQPDTIQDFAFARHEAAAIVQGGVPARDANIKGLLQDMTAADMARVFNALRHDHEEKEQDFVKTHRHSWAVVGGELVGGTFRGFLLLCLDESKFGFVV